MFDNLANRIGDTYSGKKIPKRTKWIYSVSGIGRDAVYAIVATFLMIFATEVALGDAGEQYAAMMGVITGLTIGYRLFDGLNDPFMGVIIEKVHMKTGKYKPWIFIGAATNLFTVLALFLGPELFSWCHGWGFVGWFAGFYLLWGMTFTMNDISFWSMLPSLSSDQQERAKVTSLVLIFSYIGSFLASFCIPYLSVPEVLGVDAYWIMAIVVGVLFVVGQGCVFFFCKEHERDTSAEAKAERPKFKDMFVVLKRNRYTRTMIISFICYFLGTSIMNALLMNSFYLSIGYSAGKLMFSIYSIMNSLAVALPMIFVPMILKKVKIKTLFKISMITMLAGLIVFFFYGMPVGNGYISPSPVVAGTFTLNPAYAVLLALISFVIFVAQGCVYNCVIIMLTNTIEYNEYKFGRREESTIFSLRPLSAKLASSLQQGVYYIALMVTGTMAIIDGISKLNSQSADPAEIEAFIKANTNSSQIWSLKIFTVLIPIALLCVTLFLVWRCYHIDEKMYQEMCTELDKRHAQKAPLRVAKKSKKK